MILDNLSKKGLTIGIIILFIGLAVAPSISANIDEKKMIEYTTEIYGLGEGKRTIKLTQEQSKDFERLMDEIQFDFNNTKTISDAKEIVSNAIAKLDDYGLFGDLTAKSVERLILSGISRQCLSSRVVNKLNNLGFWNTNILCVIGGYCKNILFIRMLGYLVGHPNLLNFFIYPLYHINPLKLMSVIQFGSNSWSFEGPTYTTYAKGILSSIGLLGIKCWIGEMIGIADELSGQLFYSGWERYIGVIGYTGIQISRLEQYDTFLLGSAIYVSIEHV
jgi:hypothetical protein